MKKLFFALLFLPMLASAADFVSVSTGRGGLYWLPGEINGKPFNFCLDTGATHLSIPGKVAASLGMTVCEPAEQVDTANGKSSSCFVTLESVSIAGFEFTNVLAVIIPRGGDILVGNSLLKKFTVTQKNGVMTLSR